MSAFMLSGCSSPPGQGAATRSQSGSSAPRIAAASQNGPGLPHISPTPRAIRRTGPDLNIPSTVEVLRDHGTDDQSIETVVQALRSAGASEVHTSTAGAAVAGRPTALTVVIGRSDSPAVASLLKRSAAFGPGELPAEGYAITTDSVNGRGDVLLAGKDSDGVYYAAQTFAQIASRSRVAGVSIVDFPAMSRRGVVEGFYGRPWTHEDRLDQLTFYGRMKFNTYLYAPKDDPFERDRWRDRYPPEQARRLSVLAHAASRRHVRFTYVLSPGKSICYNSARDRRTVLDKLGSLYELGIRNFAIAFDDIHPLPVWNCAADFARWGAVTQQAMATAQSDLLNRIQHEFVDRHRGLRSLVMVPTQYSDLSATLYKKSLRRSLDQRITMMWTGTDVLPTSITADQARQAVELWNRDVLLWDNYPVNDSDQAAGRLLLAPYANRSRALGNYLSGVVLNPMNQASASKAAEFTGADYAWNPQAYDPAVSAQAAADHLSDGDADTAEALRVFFDTQHLAPSWKGAPWQPQAPALAARLKEFDRLWTSGHKDRAVARLRAYAAVMVNAPQRITAHVPDRALITEAEPWLDAMALWAHALTTTCDSLTARLNGDAPRADELQTRSRALAKQASVIRTIPGATRPQGTVKVADGVLDTFLEKAASLR
ncbi:beta-N-acetylhexosaminidase family protein [Streptomyces albospinus]|uniref:beta-N-acetylhexosaminidase family protein n=1 Tax=Streptomyces albospinus TaxID=285515 RepID=UPI001E2F736B|nr:beta-N-acetylglucosaminidase domain-containing protein [Streptomyces albospinus]